jgi:hypothetical protein
MTRAMEVQSAEPESIVDSTAQRVDAFVLILGRIVLGVGFRPTRNRLTRMPVYSRRAKNAPERVLVEVETSHCDWEHRSSLVDDLAFGA